MKAAGAFNGLPRELCHNMRPYTIELALMRVYAVCEAGHCPVFLAMLKDSERNPKYGVIHEKENLECDCRSLDCSSCILGATSAATAQQTPQYQVGGFPITPHQMLVLQPSARMGEQQRLSRQPTMDARRHPEYPDPGLANTGF
jgi:hypothetical protein